MFYFGYQNTTKMRKKEIKIQKNNKEIEIYNLYIKWLHATEPIPLHIVENYKKEIKNLKK